jgi:glycosyltransferase involved in cell wall biosynthesis
MKLSVVIPCFNGSDTIGFQLEALANQQWSESWEVIVADNGSTDNSMEIARRYKNRLPNLRIVDASARRGQPYALNVGVKAALGESVAFCDADDEVAPGWVSAMGNALSKYDLVACRMEMAKLNPAWVLKSRSNPQESGVQKYTYPPYLPHAGGGTLGVKRRLWEVVGGFDESFPLLHDTDFCWKVQRTGIKLEFVPDAVIHIRFRTTIKSILRQSFGYAEYNVKIYKKYIKLEMPKLSWRSGVRSWINFFKGFIKNIPRLRNKENLAFWTWQFGWRLGRLKGSIKYKVFAL